MPHPHKLSEFVLERQTRELPPQVHGVSFTVDRVVQSRVRVGENVLGGDVVIPVVLPELSQTPFRDVADALAALCVAVEGEALGITR